MKIIKHVEKRKYTLILICLSFTAYGQTDIPENASSFMTRTKTGWVCNPGYKQVGFSCEKFDLPDNARLYGQGNTWRCDRGYKKENEQCLRVNVPANAVLDVIGNSWICSTGYKREGNLCVAVKTSGDTKSN